MGLDMIKGFRVLGLPVLFLALASCGLLESEISPADTETRNGLIFKIGDPEPLTGTIVKRAEDGSELQRYSVIEGLRDGWSENRGGRQCFRQGDQITDAYCEGEVYWVTRTDAQDFCDSLRNYSNERRHNVWWRNASSRGLDGKLGYDKLRGAVSNGNLSMSAAGLRSSLREIGGRSGGATSTDVFYDGCFNYLADELNPLWR